MLVMPPPHLRPAPDRPLPRVQANVEPILLLSHKHDLKVPLQLCQDFLLQLFQLDMYHSLPKAQLSSMRAWLATAQQLHLQQLEEALRACMFDCLVKVAPRYCSRCRRWGGFSECSGCSGWQESGVRALDEIIAQWVFGAGRPHQSEQRGVQRRGQKGELVECAGSGVCSQSGDASIGKKAGAKKVGAWEARARRCGCEECTGGKKVGEAGGPAALLLGVQEWGELVVQLMAL